MKLCRWRKLPEDHKFADASPEFTGLALLSGERYVLAASGQTLYRLDIRSGSLENFLEANGTIQAIAASMSGNVLVIVSSRGDWGTPSKETILEVWDLESKQLRYKLSSKKDLIKSIDISQDGRLAVSSYTDRTVRVWGIERGSQRCILGRHSGPVDQVKLAKSGTLAISVGHGLYSSENIVNSLNIWSLTAPEIPKADHDGPVSQTVAIPGCQLGASSGRDEIIRLWNLVDGREVGTLKGHCGSIYEMMAISDGRHLISAGEDAAIKIWDLDHRNETASLTGHTDAVSHLAMSKDGKRLISGALLWNSSDNQVLVWDMETPIRRLALPQSQARTIAISPDGAIGAWSIGDYRVDIWDLRIGKLRRTLEVRSSSPVLLFTPCGTKLIVHDLGSAEVWSVDNWEKILTIPWGFSNSLVSANVLRATEDSRYLVAGGDKIAVWDLQLRSKVSERPAMDDTYCLAVDPAGEFLVSASGDGLIEVWDIRQSYRRAVFTADYPIRHCDLSFDRTRVIAGDSGGYVHILRLEAANLVDWEAKDCRRKKKRGTRGVRAKPIIVCKRRAL